MITKEELVVFTCLVALREAELAVHVEFSRELVHSAFAWKLENQRYLKETAVREQSSELTEVASLNAGDS